MNTAEPSEHRSSTARPEGLHHPYRALVLKGAVSGVLMGLANLVPGVSAGAVLLATGIFTLFLGGIAELASLRFRVRNLVLLGSMGAGWVAAVLLGAGLVKALVLEHRWIMYSVFIGLTLGGVPLVWIREHRARAAYWVAAAAGLAIMAGLGAAQMLGFTGNATQHSEWWLLLVGGLLAAGATVLPGGSGTYVLLLMGLYVPILTAVSDVRHALTGMDFGALLVQARTLAPFAIGMGLGLVSVSLLTKWALARFPAATMGSLLGLLLGSVVGLWPFQAGAQPAPGDIVKGRAMTPELLAQLKPDDWPVRVFAPGAWQVVVAGVLIVVALLATLAITRLEARLEQADRAD